MKGVILTEEKSGALERFLNMTTTAAMTRMQERIVTVIRSFLPTFLDETPPVDSGWCEVAEGGSAVTGLEMGMNDDARSRTGGVSSRWLETTSACPTKRYPRRGRVSI